MVKGFGFRVLDLGLGIQDVGFRAGDRGAASWQHMELHGLSLPPSPKPCTL
jgi:hypothetical protein